MGMRTGSRALLAAALLAVCLLLAACGGKPGAQVWLDGTEWKGSAEESGADGLRVYITLGGRPLIDLPFDERHTVHVVQPDGSENEVELTGASVRMAHANCEGQDCVHMGEVTRENLEVRVMGGFIICLPHKLSVEVRGE